MGYFSQYSVMQLANPVSREELATLIACNEEASHALDREGDPRGYVKWYDHEECLRVWSLRFPKTVFRLHAEGEDSDGIWDKYFIAGVLVHAEYFAGLPEIDLRKLLKKQRQTNH